MSRTSTKRQLGQTISPIFSIIVIICASLLLGVFFSYWNQDYASLWSINATEDRILAHASSVAYYERLASAPAWYNGTITGLLLISIGFSFIKVVLNGRIGLLFDGATLLLLISAGTVYLTTVKTTLSYFESATSIAVQTEALQSLAASHMLISVAITGILSLQAGQFYAEKER